MSEFMLKNCGLVVIDDDQKEAELLLAALNKAGISYLYYDGEDSGLPESHLDRVRFAFVDLRLKGIPETEWVKNSASKIVSILQKLIRQDNGPYALVYWSKHSEDEDTKKNFESRLSEYCKVGSISPPVCFCEMEKNDCREHGTFDYINQKLSENLKEASALQLYVEWERIVAASASECILEFSEAAGSISQDDWSKKTGKLFYHLYKNFVGKREEKEHKQRFRYAAHILNRIFFDKLEHNVDHSLDLPDGFQINAPDIDFESKSKFNTALLLSSFKSKVINTGDVFIVLQNKDVGDQGEEFARLSKAINKGTAKETCPLEAQLVFVIITPSCDLAQNKHLSLDKLQLHRGVYGLLYHCDSENTEKTVRNSFKGGDAVFDKIQTFFYKDQHCVLVFNFHSLTTLWDDSPVLSTESYLFSLKNEILHDLQSKAASHVNRIGHLDLD